MLASLVSVYYYLRVVVFMFMKDEEYGNPVAVDTPGAVALLACSGLLIFFGLFPTGLLELAHSAVAAVPGPLIQPQFPHDPDARRRCLARGVCIIFNLYVP